ncbi:hypothetical protein [Tuberibacillus sp. Marseille-P3662]|uniref:hypothetical protein n=1 Tax=Tuberibacillus sp. Marseille-P3662 TaxID=1965358 RepID=UPI000A1C951F|nr:hypothetical protein [Tuberibacillus sp. Marseille-P3662]
MFEHMSLFPLTLEESLDDEGHDRYDVYVNDDFVGIKSLMATNDRIDDLNEFLQEEGFQHFNTEASGGHFHIQSENEANVDSMKDVLHVYLQSR